MNRIRKDLALRRQARLADLVSRAGIAGVENAIEDLDRRGAAGPRALGELLVERGILDQAQLDQFLHSLDRPEQIGPYVLEAELGRGGMAVVYRARHVELDRLVALKVVQDPALLERFHREALAVAKLRHPHIVTVHDAGREYIAMELIEGPTLAEARLALRDRIVLLAKVADALHHAHGLGVIHRDLKPGNILIDAKGEPRLVDFGLARLNVAGLTRPGTILGTPQYMSPEQVLGRTTGPASDIYSLGVILYQMLADRPPFDALQIDALYHQILNTEPATLPKTVPRDLRTICVKCLEKDPERRYRTAGAAAADLTHWLHGEPISARAPSIWRGFVSRRRVAILAVALLGAGGAGALLVPKWREAARQKADRDQALARQEQARPFLDAGRSILNRLDRLLMTPDWTDDERRDFAAKARREFARALEACPDHPDAILETARAYRMEGDETRALEWYGRSTLGSARLERAFLNLDRYERLRHESGGGVRVETPAALELRGEIDADLNAVRAASQDRIELVGAEGMFLFADGRYEEAARKLQEYAEASSSDPRGWAWTGHAWLHVPGRGVEAVAAFTKSLRYRPRQASVLFMRAHERQQSGDLEGALADFTEAIRIQPRDARSHLHRGLLHRSRGDRKAALADFEKSLELEPTETAYVSRGMIRQEDGDSAGALADFNRAVELHPSARAYVARGVIHFERQDLDLALSDFTRAVEVEPDNATAWFDRGNVRLALEDSEGAIADFTEAHRLNPKSSRTVASRGLARARKGDRTGAREDYDEAIRLDPNCEEAYHNRGHLRERDGDREGAKEDYRKALDVAPPGWKNRWHVEQELRRN